MGWLPGPVKVHLTETFVEPALCSFLVYFDWAEQQSASMLNLLLAYTLFATIVRRIDLHETRDMYYYKFLAIFWLPTLLIPLLSLLETTHVEGTGFCAPKSLIVITLKQLSWFIPFAVQIILIVPVFKVVYEVTRSVRNSVSERSHQNGGRLWLCARFIGAQCNQVAIWFPGNVWQIMVLRGVSPSWALTVFIASSWIFPSLNGFIVLAGNTPLKHSMRHFGSRFCTFCSSKVCLFPPDSFAQSSICRTRNIFKHEMQQA
eukprot:Phypoly_transcript_12518.p1 GENE.Phypoly_transcript_12518~~Phypoly_transcript_12518.p1  ORF type:complete len:260 (+),score=12.46 Phypoly_transcript_12518:152-931(+)